MKLSVITDEIDADLETAVAVMSEFGIKAAELRQLWDKNIVDAPREYWERARDILVKNGMYVVGIASPFLKCDLPGDIGDEPGGRMHNAQVRGMDEQAGVLARAIDAAHYFDTNLVRVFSFWRRGPLTDAKLDIIVNAFRQPAAIAASKGIVLGIENEGACYIGTGEELARLLDRIASYSTTPSPFQGEGRGGVSSVRAIWDPGNALLDGEVPYPHGYQSLRRHIQHVHIKDYTIRDGYRNPKWAIVGDGDVDYRGMISALASSGYDGYLSLETHYDGPGAPADASRECLTRLRDLVDQIPQPV